ncbi:MAG TPA: PEP-CTERM sorting domain-containing protein, partial [Burkholderiales bacterium]|nr:PEP-CTERM sorting domain-containing protein [Burkholderiales bacterium]
TLTNVKVNATGSTITTNNEDTATHWSKDKYGPNGTSIVAKNQLFLNDLNGGGGPAQTILGPASNGNYGNMYSSVNNSIYGNRPHNPFIQYQAKFKITTAPGLLANAQVNNVQIGFGTVAGCMVPTHRVPEPGMLSLFAMGAAALGFSRRKFKR